MNKYKLLESKFLAARVANDEVAKNLLSVLKGGVDSEMKSKSNNLTLEESTIKIAKSMHKVLSSAIKLGVPMDLEIITEKELSILNQFIPEELSDEEIISKLDAIELMSLPNFGARMGKAMKELKGLASGDRVKTIITENY